MAILKIKKVIEDLENNTNQALGKITKAAAEVAAAEETAGIAELATNAEAADKTAPDKILVPSNIPSIMIADANLSAAAQDAISKKHSQNTDTALGAVGIKNPPVDADKSLYRDSAASDALVTSTWSQIKAFLKTYFDTIYGADAVPDATETVKGKVELATDAETAIGTDTTRTTTPANVTAKLRGSFLL